MGVAALSFENLLRFVLLGRPPVSQARAEAEAEARDEPCLACAGFGRVRCAVCLGAHRSRGGDAKACRACDGGTSVLCGLCGGLGTRRKVEAAGKDDAS